MKNKPQNSQDTNVTIECNETSLLVDSITFLKVKQKFILSSYQHCLNRSLKNSDKKALFLLQNRFLGRQNNFRQTYLFVN